MFGYIVAPLFCLGSDVSLSSIPPTCTAGSGPIVRTPGATFAESLRKMLGFASIRLRLCHGDCDGFSATDRVSGCRLIDHKVEAASIGTMTKFQIPAPRPSFCDRFPHMHFQLSDVLGPPWCGSIQFCIDRLSRTTCATNVGLTVTQHQIH